ncbi:serine/threonine protein kinase [Oculatella sp. LEGE 06141]|uniref:serine/threonine-protein kinase n=1 Tax=Oculatella sp. LEGE 06141 TaxID=1828648 RepID=UPI00187F20A2|nr:serine/threonine-protein kinase [Oculatella sp. LEGE 06141]MBE9180083.1 serine/threonine protein kinase [Oculatella sp. LEGE 06141]
MIGQLLTGRYLILKKLGAGGFSETYLARDKYLPHHPLCVVKFLKVSPDSTISKETAQRLFETEARILDQLGQHHTQIPKLFAYCHEQDQIYQVQEYIEGENLGTVVAQGRRLTPDMAIALLLEVLPVLGHIHTHRIIHRDIKPSNLIRRHHDGQIVLIDFGAACIHADNTSQIKSSSDDAPLAIGTPGYMPEEQHAGISWLNSDLYALGILVIHLMTGIHPQQFQPDPILGELEWKDHLIGQSIEPKFIAILERLVRRQARDRYQSVDEVLNALQSLSLAKKRAATPWMLPKQLRSLQPMIKPLAAVAVVAGLAVGGHVSGLNAQAGAAMMWIGNISRPANANMNLTLLRDLPVNGAIEQMLIAPNNQQLITAGTDHVLRLWDLPAGSLTHSLSGHTSTITALDMSRDGTLLVSGGDDRTVHLWNTTSGSLVRSFTEHPQAITSVAISPDARTLVSGSKDGMLRLWDVQTGALLHTLKIPNAAVTAVAYGATPNRLISAGSDRRLQVWNLQTGQLERTFAGHTAPIIGLQVVDERTLLSFGEDRALEWDLKREELVRVFSEDSAKPLTAMLSDQHIVTVYDNGNIRVWDKTGQLMSTVSEALGQNLEVVLSSNHRYLVSWSPEQQLQVWQMSRAEVH